MCQGQAATITGNASANYITGTSNADVIQAGGGNDTIFGKGGNDLICAGAGNDAIDGQAGSDPVYGGLGNDLCIASTFQEHSLHHGCEIHLTQPPTDPPAPSATSAPTVLEARVAQGAQQAAKANPAPSAVAGDCGDFCYGGAPRCSIDNHFIDMNHSYNGVSGAPVTSSLYSPQSYVAVTALLYNVFKGQSTFTPTTTYLLPDDGNSYYVPPNPSAVGTPLGGTFQLWTFFAWSPDGTNWTSWYWSAAQPNVNDGINRSEFCSA
jgi:Ca2+-binding RTX toxin-like protein